MVLELPTEQREIRARLRRHERELRRSKKLTGVIIDRHSRRYEIGALYLALGDAQGALDSYAWFKRNQEHPSLEPFDHLSWTLALYRTGHLRAASRKLAHTALRNVYLIPALLGQDPQRHNLWHSFYWAERSYVDWGLPAMKALWDLEALDWVRREFESVRFQAMLDRFLELWTRLCQEPNDLRRMSLSSEMRLMQQA